MTSRAAIVWVMAASAGAVACDDTAPADRFGTDGPDVDVTIGVPDVAEQVLTSGDGDDLFPDLDGDQLVWVRIRVDQASVPAGTDAPDCLACPYCTGCVWQVRHRDLGTEVEQLLYEGGPLVSAPRVGDGRVSWMGNDGTNRVVSLDGAVDQSNSEIRYGASPVPGAGLVWFAGYWQPLQRQALVAWDPDGDAASIVLPVNVAPHPWTAQSGLADRGRQAGFALDDARVVWLTWDDSDVHVLDLERPTLAEITTVVVDPAERAVAVALAGERVVTTSYDAEVGCSDSDCALRFTVHDGSGAHPIASDARPTRFVRAVATADFLVWVDHRDGPYAVWAAPLDGGAPTQLSSDAARVGVLSALAVGGGRAIWADRRAGRWHLVARALSPN